ncbi:MAG: TIGR00270 family protein [Nanoarchaeota archaeon]|nr:TIGR00270 family protein [Nanoarchaeota archaeon]
MGSCDICGKDTKLFRAKIEGTMMKVCRDCSKFGKVIGEVKIAIKDTARQKVATIYAQEEEEIVEEVVPDYSTKLLKARQKKKMDQMDFARFVAEKESVVSKLETGSLKPSLKLARKLQNRLGIKLIQVVKEEKFELESGTGKDFTLGDFIKKKK